MHKSIFLSHKYENLSKYSVVLIEQDTIDSSPQCPALIDVIGNIKVGFQMIHTCTRDVCRLPF